MTENLKWEYLPCVGVFKDGDKVWFRSYRGDVWKGRYDSFENHKNWAGDYPQEVVKRQ